MNDKLHIGKTKRQMIAVKKEKGNPDRNKERKKFLENITFTHGKLYACWLSVQTEDVIADS